MYVYTYIALDCPRLMSPFTFGDGQTNDSSDSEDHRCDAELMPMKWYAGVTMRLLSWSMLGDLNESTGNGQPSSHGWFASKPLRARWEHSSLLACPRSDRDSHRHRRISTQWRTKAARSTPTGDVRDAVSDCCASSLRNGACDIGVACLEDFWVQ